MNTETLKKAFLDNTFIVMGAFFGVLILGMYIERKKQDKE